MRAHHNRSVSGEGRFAGEHLISDYTETVNVRSRVDISAATLFGRHVERRSHNRTDARQRWSLCSGEGVFGMTSGGTRGRIEKQRSTIVLSFGMIARNEGLREFFVLQQRADCI